MKPRLPITTPVPNALCKLGVKLIMLRARSITAIVDRNRLFYFRGVVRKIFIAKQPAVVFREPGHFARHVAFIEAITSGLQSFMTAFAFVLRLSFNQPPEGAREIRIAKDFAG